MKVTYKVKVRTGSLSFEYIVKCSIKSLLKALISKGCRIEKQEGKKYFLSKNFGTILEVQPYILLNLDEFLEVAKL